MVGEHVYLYEIFDPRTINGRKNDVVLSVNPKILYQFKTKKILFIFSRRQYVADIWQQMVCEHMAHLEREKYPELEMTPSSPVPGKSSGHSEIGDNDSGFSDG